MNRLNKEAHVVEELNGTRCSIVEKNVNKERAEFLKYILEGNGYSVIVAPAPPPKAPPAKTVPPAPIPPPTMQGQSAAPAPVPVTTPVSPSPSETRPQSPDPVAPILPPAPELFYVGVTNIAFHAMLAVYERSLRRPDGKPVSIAYWNQEEEKEKWYWKNTY